MTTRHFGNKPVSALPTAAQAYLALELQSRSKRNLLWIVSGTRTLERVGCDLDALSCGTQNIVSLFPADNQNSESNVGVNERLAALKLISQSKEKLIVATSVHALLQSAISPRQLALQTIELKLGDDRNPEELSETLVEMGFLFTPEVQMRGEASWRGGIVDVWPPAAECPLRLEFFGDTVESIRLFNPDDQTSVEKIDQISILPPNELTAAADKASLLNYFDPDTMFLSEYGPEFDEHAELAEKCLESRAFEDWASARKALAARFNNVDSLRDAEWMAGMDSVLASVESVPRVKADLQAFLEPESMAAKRREYLAELARRSADGMDVHLHFYTAGEKERFIESFGKQIDFSSFTIHHSLLSQGFMCRARNLMVVAESDLSGHTKEFQPHRLKRVKGFDRGRAVERVQAWTDLQPGDYVVHVDCGVGRYLGLYEINSHEGAREMLAIEYRDEARLYVPTEHAHLLSRYIGIGRGAPTLHRLGGTRWQREKKSAERSIKDLAASMLETQAARETKRGFAFKKDGMLQREFENGFPYEETADQLRAIGEVKRDMESPRPMDRLICGDVGYGKTEVAMRAAFKAVASGKQVAVLVPTTVLAQQHYETFVERMQSFPVHISMLSRFRTRAQQQQSLAELAAGKVDIVIGTHRLVQADIRFKNLGLVIIDEEQRFGVEQKERLKQLRSLVDVLTLTATPIPRTLYMSLAGAKDMSTIQTAPRERVAVETVVAPFSEELVRTAVLRELDRDGQVFMLHNRVASIYNLNRKLCELVPEARIAVAHGQMPESELAAVMRSFTGGELDVLLCTTIIESGVDIPNVNTILIDRADRFGLADLYQLRGRVGRYNRKAYAYLLLPRHGDLFDTARKRISAIQRYSSLGAGFNLALRDLEIRGAGNMLGRKQSGHIAAIGFDLYCQLLKQTVDRLSGRQPKTTVDVEVKLDFIQSAPGADDSHKLVALTYDYIEDENLRLKFYRDLARCASEREVSRHAKRLVDQFGKMPAATRRLIEIAKLRAIAAGKGIDRIEVREDKVMLKRGDKYLMDQNRFPRLQTSTTGARLREIKALLKDV